MLDPEKQREPSASPDSSGEGASEIQSANVLEDLLLQAEIFLQYGMKPRALERAERIARQFPGEHTHNTRLRSLYIALGFSPHAGGAVAARTAAEEQPEDAIVDVARVSEMTRNIFRQASVRSLLSTAVNEIGRTWRVSRCVAGFCNPGRPPTAAVEFFAPGLAQADVKSIVLVLTTMSQATANGEVVQLDDVADAPAFAMLAPVRKTLDLRSLLALPLVETGQAIGVLVLQQCERLRRWRANDVAVLRSLAEQIVLTAAHIRLRSMVRSLSLADEGSGLLSRNAYLDCLLSECTRAQKQKTAVTVILLQFAPQRTQAARQVDQELESFMQQAGQSVAGQLRQNDIAIRYDTGTVAAILPDTGGRDAFVVLDKFRRVCSSLRLDGQPAPMAAGVAEAVNDGSADPVDTVTEVINRVETALEAAKTEGESVVKLALRPSA